jgi:FkbM family methyltransferase
MKKFLFNSLQKLDIFDFLKIVKDKYFRFGSSKKVFEKRVNFYSQFIKRDSLCFDVGANYGNRTEAFLELGAKVVAIEPQPKPLKFLQRRYKDNAIIIDKALGEREGQITLYISNSSSLTSASKDWVDNVSKGRFSESSWNDEISVSVTTLDQLIKKYGRPEFCKIDVEGYELEVIKGLSQPISLISFEFTIPEFTDKAIKCINYLNNIGEIECNYSVGESLKLALDVWLAPEKFISVFNKLHLDGIIDGDIYVRFTSKILNE